MLCDDMDTDLDHLDHKEEWEREGGADQETREQAEQFGEQTRPLITNWNVRECLSVVLMCNVVLKHYNGHYTLRYLIAGTGVS